jgi:heterodisulfide reductase subunit A-like polyferredoxin
MAPAGVLERIRALAESVPGIVHSQLVFSVCNPRGAEQIARTMAEKDISRVILASCVCCPLNFHCISCNDQRTRARLHLFETQGLERSRFEMINLRDHLAGGDRDEDRMLDAARDLLRSAFIRVRFLKSLHQGSTELGRRVLVLGGSPAGVSAARNLALQGFKVRLVHRARPRGEDTPPALAERPLADGLERGIVQAVEAEIDGIQGRMGDFSIRARIDGRWRTWKSDVVCLCDQHLLAMSMYAGRVGLKKFYRYDFAFFNTPQPGVFRIMPRTLERVDAFQAGAAMAGEVAASAARAHLHDHQLSPVVDPDLCRGCGRCVEICPFEAVRLVEGSDGTFTAQVFRHNCVGCGGCGGRCPGTAMDIPYFTNRRLDQMAAGRLVWER